MAEVDYDFEGKTEGDILLSYKATKGHRTRNFNKITNLLTLQEQKYSKFTEANLITAVKEMERQMDKLVILAAYLQLHGLNSAAVHVAEANNLIKPTADQAAKVLISIHEHDADADPGVAWPAAQGHAGAQLAAKPVLALKPEKLNFDDNLGALRRWKQRYTSFHQSSNFRLLPITDQQAFLIACIDDDIANRIIRVVTETTPVLPNAAGNPCCLDVIDGLFREKNPVLLRRAQMLGYKQQDGQDGINWREELRNIADDADVDEMTTADLFCVLYVTGVKDNALREKLLEIQDPSIEKFDRTVDAFDQAKTQMADMKKPASASLSSRPKSTVKRDAKKPPRTAAGGGRANYPSLSKEEVKRREMMLGRCYRCGKSDHTLPDCPQPPHWTCSNCGRKGHSKFACLKSSANAAAANHPDGQLHHQMQNLSLAQQQHGHQPTQADQGGASAFTCQHPNQPTPTVLL